MTEESSTDQPEEVTFINPKPGIVNRILHTARQHLDTSVTVQYRDNKTHGIVGSTQPYRPALDSAFGVYGSDDSGTSLAESLSKKPVKGTTRELVVKKDPVSVPTK